MYKDIDKWVDSCKICNKAGESLCNARNTIIKASFPNEIWEIDLIGRIPGQQGKTTILWYPWIIIITTNLFKCTRNTEMEDDTWVTLVDRGNNENSYCPWSLSDPVGVIG